MKKPRDAGPILGAGALGVSALALLAAVGGALGARPAGSLPVVHPGGAAPAGGVSAGDVAVEPEAGPGEAVATQAASVTDDVLRAAVEKAPFAPDRRAADPYLLPEERPQPPPARVQRPEPDPAPAFRVLGTVADARGGIAVVEAPGEPPRVLALGDEILGYRLSSIQDGRVVLGTDQGRSVSVAVPDVAPRAATESRVTRATENGNQRGGGGGGRGGVSGAAAADLVNQAMQRLREQSGGNVRMEMRGDRVILTAPDGTRREIQIGGGGEFEMDVAPAVPARPTRAAPTPPAGPRRPGGGGA